MISEQNNNKRMAKNTLLMYFRMFILIGVQLYTVPIVLSALGVEDYGIYSVVGGFVAMFTFINSSLVSGIQRFMAYAIGQNNQDELKEAFDTSIFIFVTLALALFLLIEFCGIWFLNNKMNIPQNKIIDANYVFQFSVLSLVVTLLATPFNAAVIAHEKMSVFAYASILESVYKLLVAFVLTTLVSDKLIIYALLIFVSSLIFSTYYCLYCKRCFYEARNLKLHYNKKLLGSIGTYAGWNIIGASAIILRNHGLNVLLSMFFNPLINAAHTIASNINGLFNQFVINVYMATRPQMVKLYACGDAEGMWKLTFKSSKYAFFLMSIISVPIVIEMPLLLTVWLKEVPEYTIIFSRLIILSTLIETMANQIIGVFQAANKIKYYQSVSSIILLLIIPGAYFLLRK